MEMKANQIGDRIKAIRESMGLSQREFADQAGLSTRAIQNYELGSSIPGGKILGKIAELGFNVNWVLTGKGETKSNDINLDYYDAIDLFLLESIIQHVDKSAEAQGFLLPPNVRNTMILNYYIDIKVNKKTIYFEDVNRDLSEKLASNG